MEEKNVTLLDKFKGELKDSDASLKAAAMELLVKPVFDECRHEVTGNEVVLCDDTYTVHEMYYDPVDETHMYNKVLRYDFTNLKLCLDMTVEGISSAMETAKHDCDFQEMCDVSHHLSLTSHLQKVVAEAIALCNKVRDAGKISEDEAIYIELLELIIDKTWDRVITWCLYYMRLYIKKSSSCDLKQFLNRVTDYKS